VTSRLARVCRPLVLAAASLLVLPALGACTPTEPADRGQACGALVQVLADGRQVRTQLAALGSPASSPGAPARQLLAGGLQEDVESAREVLDALPASVAPTTGRAARAGATALLAGDAAGAAVRTSAVPTALSALQRMGTAVGTARDLLGCG